MRRWPSMGFFRPLPLRRWLSGSVLWSCCHVAASPVVIDLNELDLFIFSSIFLLPLLQYPDTPSSQCPHRPPWLDLSGASCFIEEQRVLSPPPHEFWEANQTWVRKGTQYLNAYLLFYSDFIFSSLYWRRKPYHCKTAKLYHYNFSVSVLFDHHQLQIGMDIAFKLIR